MNLSHELFHVYKTGRLTVLGFHARHLGNPAQAGECLTRLLDLVQRHDCEFLVVDLTNVEIVSSWILGILAAVKQRGVQVELYHPSREIRDVLATTHLDSVLHVRHDSGVA